MWNVLTFFLLFDMTQSLSRSRNFIMWIFCCFLLSILSPFPLYLSLSFPLLFLSLSSTLVFCSVTKVSEWISRDHHKKKHKTKLGRKHSTASFCFLQRSCNRSNDDVNSSSSLSKNNSSVNVAVQIFPFKEAFKNFIFMLFALLQFCR